MQGKRCKFCANNVRHDIDYVRKLVGSVDGYELLSDEYTNWETMLTIKCNNGHIFTASYNSFEQGHRCPHCNRSNGEDEVARILDKYEIEYYTQYKFDDCVDKYALPFDFYIPLKNVCLEYNGRQHYEPVDYFGGEESFTTQKKHDSIKNDYCKNNDIKLITIPYWNYNNIESILIEQKVI